MSHSARAQAKRTKRSHLKKQGRAVLGTNHSNRERSKWFAADHQRRRAREGISLQNFMKDFRPEDQLARG